MKLYILMFVFAIAQAKNFTVRDKGQSCLLLQLDGTVHLTSNKTDTKSLTFENASLIDSSNCTLIKLNLTTSVEVWFQFQEVSDGWTVIPRAQFVPQDVFGTKFNKSEPVNYTASALEGYFRKNESYQCKALTPRTFQEDDKQPKYVITVTADTTDFQIQSLNEDHFVPGETCDKDKTTTSASVTTTPKSVTTTSKPATTTALQPSSQNFSCKFENTTRFRLIGTFVLSITYNTTDAKKTNTTKIDVPHPEIEEKECNSTSNQTLVFKFFSGWSIEYIFSTVAGTTKQYYVADITVTYVNDAHLPGTADINKTVIASYSKLGYLKASTSGYYTCTQESLKINQQVTLSIKDFKYKAFNEKGDIDFKSKEYTECSADDQSSSVVPIAVGAALAGLVVIVLIAYIIGRRRSHKAGYESV